MTPSDAARSVARLGWQPSTAGEFWVEGNHYRENDAQRYDYFVPPNHVPQDRTEVDTRNRFTAGGEWTWASGLRVQVKGVDERYDSVSDEYSNGEHITTRTAAQRMDHLSAQFDLPKWGSQSWQFGLDDHREQLAQTSNGSAELTGGRVSRTNRELYAQNDIELGRRWELVAGLRWQDDSGLRTHAAPKLALRHHVARCRRLECGRAGQRGPGLPRAEPHRAPLPLRPQLARLQGMGNPDLKPESSDSFQLGGTLAWQSRGDARSQRLSQPRQEPDPDRLWRTRTVVNGIAIYTYRNVARARTSGIETGLKWRAAPSLELSGAYTFDLAKDADTGADLTRRPRHMARLGADWDVLEGTQLTVRARAQSSDLADSATGARSPGWSTLDFKISQRLASQPHRLRRHRQRLRSPGATSPMPTTSARSRAATSISGFASRWMTSTDPRHTTTRGFQ